MFNSLAELRAALHQKKLSCVEAIQYYLEQIERYNPHLNAFITVTGEAALEQAKQADKAIANNEQTLLTGVPIAHKDIFCTQGVKTSCASKMLSHFTPPYSSTVTQKLEHAGAISLGKLNMDEFAMGSSNETSFYGPVKNPWGAHHVPGGSSGGSAAAVSAGLISGATGTDTGGSIRQPAAWCGITGLKPTYGRVSRYGMIAFASSLDQAGPMARTAEDCALLLQAMSGFDEKDATSAQQAVPNYLGDLNTPLKGLKIGLPRCFFNDTLDTTIATVLEQAIAVYRDLGAECVDIDLPHNHLSLAAYYILAPAEASSNLARYDGVRFGHRCEAPQDLTDLYERSRQEGFGSEVKRRILMGTYSLSSGFYDAYYQKAQKIRRLLSQDFNQAFEQVDLILGPVTPGPAFTLGAKQQDPTSMYLTDIYTLSANLAGLPALSHPAGFIHQLPVGLQLIGPAFAESRLFQAAHQYQQQTDWHNQHPNMEAFV